MTVSQKDKLCSLFYFGLLLSLRHSTPTDWVASATPDDEWRYHLVRSPSPTSDKTTSHLTKLQKPQQVIGYPPEGESDEGSLRDAQVNE